MKQRNRESRFVFVALATFSMMNFLCLASELTFRVENTSPTFAQRNLSILRFYKQKRASWQHEAHMTMRENRYEKYNCWIIWIINRSRHNCMYLISPRAVQLLTGCARLGAFLLRRNNILYQLFCSEKLSHRQTQAFERIICNDQSCQSIFPYHISLLTGPMIVACQWNTERRIEERH